MTFESIRRFKIPRDIVRQSERKLRQAGRDGYELFVLWSGRCTDESFQIMEGHVPEQTSYQGEDGLIVRVEGVALHRLNVWLYENEQQLAVQVHAHPSAAYHSDTDDAFPIVTTLGGMSIVAADFCRGGLFTDDTALYRLTELGWQDAMAETVEVV